MYKILFLCIIVASLSIQSSLLYFYVKDFLVLMQVIIPLLVSDDEKILVVCINCLTKVSHICSWYCCLIISH
jgi:hypothetical protein